MLCSSGTWAIRVGVKPQVIGGLGSWKSTHVTPCCLPDCKPVKPPQFEWGDVWKPRGRSCHHHCCSSEIPGVFHGSPRHHSSGCARGIWFLPPWKQEAGHHYHHPEQNRLGVCDDLCVEDYAWQRSWGCALWVTGWTVVWPSCRTTCLHMPHLLPDILDGLLRGVHG